MSTKSNQPIGNADNSTREPVVLESRLTSDVWGEIWRGRRASRRGGEEPVLVRVLATEPHLEAHRAAILRSANLASTLAHVNILRVLDVDETRGLVIEELLKGITLQELVDAPAGRMLHGVHALHIVAKVLRALAFLHARQDVDGCLGICASNVIITVDGQIKVGALWHESVLAGGSGSLDRHTDDLRAVARIGQDLLERIEPSEAGEVLSRCCTRLLPPSGARSDSAREVLAIIDEWASFRSATRELARMVGQAFVTEALPRYAMFNRTFSSQPTEPRGPSPVEVAQFDRVRFVIAAIPLVVLLFASWGIWDMTRLAPPVAVPHSETVEVSGHSTKGEVPQFGVEQVGDVDVDVSLAFVGLPPCTAAQDTCLQSSELVSACWVIQTDNLLVSEGLACNQVGAGMLGVYHIQAAGSRQLFRRLLSMSSSGQSIRESWLHEVDCRP